MLRLENPGAGEHGNYRSNSHDLVRQVFAATTECAIARRGLSGIDGGVCHGVPFHDSRRDPKSPSAIDTYLATY